MKTLEKLTALAYQVYQIADQHVHHIPEQLMTIACCLQHHITTHLLSVETESSEMYSNLQLNIPTRNSIR